MQAHLSHVSNAIRKCFSGAISFPQAAALRSTNCSLCSLHSLLPRTVTEKYLSRDPEEEIRKAFKLFDEDGIGKISLKNMRRIARELGENLSEDELVAMIGALYRCSLFQKR